MRVTGTTESLDRLRTIRPAFGTSFSNEQVFDILDNILAWGGVVVGPSDCGYCLWALPGHPRAVALLDAIRVDHTTTLPLSVSSQLMACSLVAFNPVHQRLAAAAWPGQLTIVSKVRDRRAKSYSINVRGGGTTLGVRTSRSLLEKQLVTEAALPFISAALYASPGRTINSYAEAHDLVLDRLATVALPPAPVLGVRVPTNYFTFDSVSTVVALGPGRVPVELREGDFDRRRLTAITSRVAPSEYGDAT